jgi:hypothetical protein
MITKDKKVMCDSCSKEIKDESTAINNNGKGWARYSTKFYHFHPTSLDCANATEPIKIYMNRAMTQREGN